MSDQYERAAVQAESARAHAAIVKFYAAERLEQENTEREARRPLAAPLPVSRATVDVRAAAALAGGHASADDGLVADLARKVIERPAALAKFSEGETSYGPAVDAVLRRVLTDLEASR